MATSQGYFSKWQLLKCQISQATTSQVCPSHSSRPPPYNVLSAALGHPLQPVCLRGHILTFRKLPLGKLHIWEVAVNFYSWFIPGYALFFYIHISRGSWRTGNRNLPQPRTGNIIINRK